MVYHLFGPAAMLDRAGLGRRLREASTRPYRSGEVTPPRRTPGGWVVMGSDSSQFDGPFVVIELICVGPFPIPPRPRARDLKEDENGGRFEGPQPSPPTVQLRTSWSSAHRRRRRTYPSANSYVLPAGSLTEADWS